MMLTDHSVLFLRHQQKEEFTLASLSFLHRLRFRFGFLFRFLRFLCTGIRIPGLLYIL